jgi:hypothetical protein
MGDLISRLADQWLFQVGVVLADEVCGGWYRTVIRPGGARNRLDTTRGRSVATLRGSVRF